MSKRVELNALERAIAWAGGQSRLAKMLAKHTGRDCDRRKVHMWKIREKLPGWWVRPLSELTGIPVEDFLEMAEHGDYVDRYVA